MDKTLTISAMGVPWYTAENYAQIRGVMEDAHLLPPTFERWLLMAEKLLETCQHQGVVAIKAYIDPATFPVWCRSRGLNINAQARMQFANAAAAAQYQQGRA